MDQEYRDLLRAAKTGDRNATLRLVQYWFRTGTGPAAEQEPPTYVLDVRDFIKERVTNEFPVTRLPGNGIISGDIVIKFRDAYSLHLEAVFNQDRSDFLTEITANFYQDYNAGWRQGRVDGDDIFDAYIERQELHRNESGRTPNTDEYLSFITFIVKRWIGIHPEAIEKAKAYSKSNEVKESFKHLEKQQRLYQAEENTLIFNVNQYLEN